MVGVAVHFESTSMKPTSNWPELCARRAGGPKRMEIYVRRLKLRQQKKKKKEQQKTTQAPTGGTDQQKKKKKKNGDLCCKASKMACEAGATKMMAASSDNGELGTKPRIGSVAKNLSSRERKGWQSCANRMLSFSAAHSFRFLSAYGDALGHTKLLCCCVNGCRLCCSRFKKPK